MLNKAENMTKHTEYSGQAFCCHGDRDASTFKNRREQRQEVPFPSNTKITKR